MLTLRRFFVLVALTAACPGCGGNTRHASSTASSFPPLVLTRSQAAADVGTAYADELAVWRHELVRRWHSNPRFSWGVKRLSDVRSNATLTIRGGAGQVIVATWRLDVTDDEVRPLNADARRLSRFPVVSVAPDAEIRLGAQCFGLGPEVSRNKLTVSLYTDETEWGLVMRRGSPDMALLRGYTLTRSRFPPQAQIRFTARTRYIAETASGQTRLSRAAFVRRVADGPTIVVSWDEAGEHPTVQRLLRRPADEIRLAHEKAGA